MEIRLTLTSDVDTVLALWRAAEALPSPTDDGASVQRIARRGNLLLTVEGNGTVVGSLIAAFDGWRGNMYRLVVADGQRRRGIARALVDAGEARLAGQGFRRITALVANSEPDAAAF